MLHLYQGGKALYKTRVFVKGAIGGLSRYQENDCALGDDSDDVFGACPARLLRWKGLMIARGQFI